MQDNIILRTNADQKIYDWWVDIDVHLMLDTVASTATFSTFITDDNKHLFKPGACTECTVEVYNSSTESYETLITGIIMQTAFSIQKEPGVDSVVVVSKSYIIQNVPVPREFYSVQFKGMSLRSIAKKLCDYYGLELFVHDGAFFDASIKYKQDASLVNVGEKYKTPTAEEKEESDIPEVDRDFKKFQAKEGESVYSFLVRLAKERGITVAHDNLGRVMLYKILNVIEATSEVNEESSSVISMKCTPNWQNMSSSSTARCESSESEDETTENTPCEYTAESPFHRGIVMKNVSKTSQSAILSTENTKLYKQPKIAVAGNIDPSELKEYADSLVCKEAKNFPVVLEWDGWFMPDIKNGGLRSVRAGFFLWVSMTSRFIARTQMVIEDMHFSKKSKDENYKVVATCVHPCVYTGKIPTETIFID